MKQITIKEFDAMTLEQAVESKIQLGREATKVEFMDHRSKNYKVEESLVYKNVSNLADSKYGSAVQDVLEQRQMEARNK